MVKIAERIVLPLEVVRLVKSMFLWAVAVSWGIYLALGAIGLMDYAFVLARPVGWHGPTYYGAGGVSGKDMLDDILRIVFKPDPNSLVLPMILLGTIILGAITGAVVHYCRRQKQVAFYSARSRSNRT